MIHTAAAPARSHRQPLESEALLKQVVRAADAMKAEDIAIRDVRGLASYADFLVFVSGTSDRHVSSIAEKVMETLKAAGEIPVSVEGLESAQWVLLDYGDVILHVFQPPVRDYYDLESMWTDAKKIPAASLLDSPSPAHDVN
ncbi:MAG: Ribosomal silencing factor RsfS [Myxococcota bacterium]|nr:Ribosomal silencing factor RsfS [Myxococcota bacterium]